MPACGNFQRRRQHSASTAHRALPVCEWPALGMPWCNARSNAASAVCSSCEASGTGGCGRGAVQVVCGGGCGFAGEWRFHRGGGSTRQPQRRTEPCQCVSGKPRTGHGALQGQMQPLLCAAGVVGPALGAAAGVLCRWFVGDAVLPVCGDFQRRRQHSAITAHRALPVCDWPSLGMPWTTERKVKGSQSH